MLTLADVLEALTGTRPEKASLVISEASVDSRQVIPASMFVALPGERVDGHNYVANAFDRGAHLALIQNDLPAPFPEIDLRSGRLPEIFSQPEPPFCLRVGNTLTALQTIAGYRRRKRSANFFRWNSEFFWPEQRMNLDIATRRPVRKFRARARRGDLASDTRCRGRPDSPVASIPRSLTESSTGSFAGSSGPGLRDAARPHISAPWP